MVNPSITNSNGVTFTFNAGDVHDIESDVVTEPDFDAMPQTTPDQAMLYDYNGVKKVITVTGELQDTGVNCLSSGTAIVVDDQRKWLEQNLNGGQSGATFTSNYTSTYNGSTWADSKVLISRFRHNENTDKPNIIPFTIILFVGDV